MKKEVPLGVRLCNLGNIRKGKQAWEGEIRSGDNETFCEFEKTEDGIRALAKIMLTYFDKHSLKTVGSIVPRYAPAKENNVQKYISAVCDMLQVRSTEELDLHNPSTLVLLVKAIIRQEVGYRSEARELWADDYVIMKGCERARQAAKEIRLSERDEDAPAN